MESVGISTHAKLTLEFKVCFIAVVRTNVILKVICKKREVLPSDCLDQRSEGEDQTLPSPCQPRREEQTFPPPPKWPRVSVTR